MALEIILLKTPASLSFTGNPIPFSLAVTPYRDIEKGQQIRISVRVEIERSFGSGSFDEIKSQVFFPAADGLINMDVHSLIEPYLQYYTPRPTLARSVAATEQRKRFRIAYLLEKDNVPVGALSYSAIYTAIKGGIAYQKWQPGLIPQLLASKKSLQVIASGEKIGVEETRYLFWVYPFNDSAEQTVVFTLYTTGAIVVYTLPGMVKTGLYGVCCTPVGFTALNLKTIVPAGETVIRYSAKVMVGLTEIVAPVIYTIDQRAFYKTHQLVYRTSLGSLETLRLRGQVDSDADYERQGARRTVAPSYYTNLNLQGTALQTSREQEKYKGDTGFLSAASNDKLRDLFLSEEVYELKGGKFLPVVVNSKSATFFSNRDNLISSQIEWQAGYVNEHYTPDDIGFTLGTCPAVEQFAVRQINKRLLQVMYALAAPYDMIEISAQWFDAFIIYDERLFRHVGNTGSVRIDIGSTVTADNPSGNVTMQVKVRTICNAETDPVEAGAWSAVSSFSFVGNAAPVANADVFNIAAGFNAAIELPGSVLANDYDPDGDAIEAVVASGATTAGGGFSVTAGGVVLYTPPTSFYTGTDSFVYNIREVGGTVQVPATVTIHVGTTAVNVYAKTVKRNVQTSTGFNPTESGEVWIDFFSDPAGTVPYDVSTLGLTVNYRKTRTVNSSVYTVEDLTVAGTGVKVKVYDGYLNIYFSIGGYNDTYTFNVLPGVGYIAL